MPIGPWPKLVLDFLNLDGLVVALRKTFRFGLRLGHAFLRNTLVKVSDVLFGDFIMGTLVGA